MKYRKAKYIVYTVHFICILQLVVILICTITLPMYRVILLNSNNGSIIQSNPYQLVMNWTCTTCKVLCPHSTVSFTIQHIAVYYPTQWMLYTHVHSYPQGFTKLHKWYCTYIHPQRTLVYLIHKIIHTLVARPFTCAIVCLPLFLKVIEKKGV